MTRTQAGSQNVRPLCLPLGNVDKSKLGLHMMVDGLVHPAAASVRVWCHSMRVTPSCEQPSLVDFGLLWTVSQYKLFPARRCETVHCRWSALCKIRSHMLHEILAFQRRTAVITPCTSLQHNNINDINGSIKKDYQLSLSVH